MKSLFATRLLNDQNWPVNVRLPVPKVALTCLLAFLLTLVGASLAQTQVIAFSIRSNARRMANNLWAI